VSNAHEDEADRKARGALPADVKANVRPIGAPVPRVYTVLDLLKSSAQRVGKPDRNALRCTTGHYRLDAITGGFRPGFTWLMGAGTSWGKSSWLVSVADENIKRGKRVLIVSSEDDESVYGDRLMIRRTGIPAKTFRDEQMEFGLQRLITHAVATAEDLPVFVDARRFPVEELAGHLGKVIKENQIDLVAFDYVQEFRTRKRFQDERIKFKEIASVLRHVAKDAKIAGVLFSQLTFDEKSKVKFPTRNNIRDCRDMAHAAEVIVLGFIPDDDIKGETPTGQETLIAKKGSKCLYVDKVKNGPRNQVVELAWDDSRASFLTVERSGAVHIPEPEMPALPEIDQHDDYVEGRF
jgi:replicative DNA helicase